MSSDTSSEPAVGDVCPKRFGLNFDPPSIILEYLQISTGKLFHRKVGLRRLRPSSDPARVAEKVRQKNRALLPEDRVSLDQIIALVRRLQEAMAQRVGAANVDYHKANLNKLSEEELSRHKAKMDIMFFKNQKKPGDPGFVYDIQVDFDTSNAQPSGWDSEEDDEED